jgi:hypothetical protein
MGAAAAVGCAWTVSVLGAATDFIRVTDPASGSSSAGDAVVGLNVVPNIRGQRSGQVVIAGVTFTVNQDAASCRYVLSGDVDRSFPAGGGSGSVNVSTPQGVDCRWTATSTSSFVTIAPPGSGTDGGSFAFSVATNSEPDRSTTIDVAGQSVRVRQASGVPTGPQLALVRIIPDTTNVELAASGLTPNGQLTLRVPGRFADNTQWQADGSGRWSFSGIGVGYGPAQLWVIDKTTGVESNRVNTNIPLP